MKPICSILGVLACVWALTVSPALAQQSAQARIDLWKMGEWKNTDFSKVAIDLREIVSGGPPRDGIPPIDRPSFETVDEASGWLDPTEPVIVYEEQGDARAYPLQILIWHEIVNDVVAGRPVVVTFCPLCNSALVFDRRVDGEVLDFGTTGKVRHSDLVMWDRQTESWWQQLTGEGIVGTHAGKKLTFLSAPLVAYETFRRAFPEGQVLSKDTGFARPYGNNPYVAYDSPGGRPFLYRGEIDPRLAPMERVVTVESGGWARAYPYALLAKEGVVQDSLNGSELVVFHQPGARSALDRSVIAASRDVGAVGVFRRELEGRMLSFRRVEGGFEDRETGSRWNLLGRAVAGPLQGKRLEPIVHANHFAFAWFAFRPDSTLWDGS
ncbi:MAG: DUF3179 domain-containing protein [SAR324 cluster bacterium]|nr:DUF3179 domain-containing protein [SAR324 cluster bacterium]